MNRGRFASGLAAAACAGAAPALAQDSAANPSLSVEQVANPRLVGAFDLATAPALEPSAGGTGADRLYRLDPPPGAATGKRAKLSIAIGKSTLFAIAGKANRSPSRVAPELSAAGSAPRQSGGGKSYGAGIERRIGAFELGAVYQYSKLAAEQADIANAPRLGGGEKSHNVRATARIRFRP